MGEGSLWAWGGEWSQITAQKRAEVDKLDDVGTACSPQPETEWNWNPSRFGCFFLLVRNGVRMFYTDNDLR
jgi:hypothetical protein